MQLSIDSHNVWYKCLPFGDMDAAVAEWLRCCATNRKVSGSIESALSSGVMPTCIAGCRERSSE